MNIAQQKLRDDSKGVSWRRNVLCPECSSTAYETSLLIPYANIPDWSKPDIFCPHCGYPHREKLKDENPDKPQI